MSVFQSVTLADALTPTAARGTAHGGECAGVGGPDLAAAVARVATDDLKLAGFAVTGPRRDVDKALDKLRLHP